MDTHLKNKNIIRYQINLLFKATNQKLFNLQELVLVVNFKISWDDSLTTNLELTTIVTYGFNKIIME